MTWRIGSPSRVVVAVVAAVLTLGEGPASTIRVDSWSGRGPGPLDLSTEWRRYPPEPTALRQPPAVVLDDGRAVLQLATAGEALRIGRAVKVDVTTTPWLVWEWKALVLPDRGDVRDGKRNDQAGRVMLAFEGMKGLLYVWDTTAPVGTEARPGELELFQRVLIVVRSGAGELGRWSTERRNVYEDYRRVFGEEPRAIKLVGVESHSNDTRSRTAIRFGPLRFEAR